jgi:hypothetical protein
MLHFANGNWKVFNSELSALHRFDRERNIVWRVMPTQVLRGDTKHTVVLQRLSTDGNWQLLYKISVLTNPPDPGKNVTWDVAFMRVLSYADFLIAGIGVANT